MYSAMDIIGIAAGIGLGSTFDENSYGNAIIVSLLGGSFLFASVVALIPGELEKMRALHFFRVTHHGITAFRIRLHGHDWQMGLSS